MNASKEPVVEPRNAPVQEPEEVVSTDKQLSCNMITKNKPDGTDVDYTLLFEFENEKLIGFTKSYSVVVTPGSENGTESIQNQIQAFQPFLTKMTGFESRVDQTENGYVAYSNADYLTMDFTQYPEDYRSNFLTKIDFALDTSYQEVLEGMTSRQFDCK